MINTNLRIIKKYPNRRLYDTKTSAYITLSDVKDLVFSFEHFKVVEAKTEEDITRSILLQIILEEESGGIPLFSTELLSQMIRFYGHAMQGALGRYLETNIQAFTEFQQRLQEHSHPLGDNSPMHKELWAQFLNFQGPAMQSMMSAYMDQSQKMLQTMQEQIQTQTRNMFSGFKFSEYGHGHPAQPVAPHNKPAEKRDGQEWETKPATDGAAQNDPSVLEGNRPAEETQSPGKPAPGASADEPKRPKQ